MRHQLDSESIGKSIEDISDNDWKKVKTEAFSVWQEYGSIKSIALIFMIEDITSDGRQKRVTLSHGS